MGIQPKTTLPWSVSLWWKTSLTSSMPCTWRWVQTRAERLNMQDKRRPTKRWVNPTVCLKFATITITALSLSVLVNIEHVNSKVNITLWSLLLHPYLHQMLGCCEKSSATRWKRNFFSFRSLSRKNLAKQLTLTLYKQRSTLKLWGSQMRTLSFPTTFS